MKELRFRADGGVWRIAFAFDPERRGCSAVPNINARAVKSASASAIGAVALSRSVGSIGPTGSGEVILADLLWAQEKHEVILTHRIKPHLTDLLADLLADVPADLFADLHADWRTRMKAGSLLNPP